MYTGNSFLKHLVSLIPEWLLSTYNISWQTSLVALVHLLEWAHPCHHIALFNSQLQQGNQITSRSGYIRSIHKCMLWWSVAYDITCRNASTCPWCSNDIYKNSIYTSVLISVLPELCILMKACTFSLPILDVISLSRSGNIISSCSFLNLASNQEYREYQPPQLFVVCGVIPTPCFE